MAYVALMFWYLHEKNCTAALSILYVALFCEFIALGGVPFSFKTGGGMGMSKGKDDMCHRWYDALG